jgi:hypothetical protein
LCLKEDNKEGVLKKLSLAKPSQLSFIANMWFLANLVVKGKAPANQKKNIKFIKKKNGKRYCMFKKTGTFDREDSSSTSKVFSKSKISLSGQKPSVFGNLSSRCVPLRTC